jgi:hypothetical protein
VERTVADNLHGWDWLWVVWVILGCVVIWLALLLMRSTLAVPRPAKEALAGAPEAGVLHGLLGGTFAALAGSWLFDSLFGNRRDQNAPAEPFVEGEQAAAGAPPAEDQWSLPANPLTDEDQTRDGAPPGEDSAWKEYYGSKKGDGKPGSDP